MSTSPKKIVFRRTGSVNSNGSVPGELTIEGKTWPTIERGTGYTFVRKGTYTKVLMCYKRKGRRVQCLSFADSNAIATHLIHDALDDDHNELEGCIAPGLSSDDNGIQDSAKAMAEVIKALGGFREWKRFVVEVQNNIGDSTETREAWIRRRESERGQ
jgi:hypothetical protein